MPSLIRFVVFCGVLAGIAYGAAFALVHYVEPEPREVLVRVPANKLNVQ
ncbi:histidine kinase [Salaquimonas pukyongi]|nr:histidine kinase [Salaquimonas pukyongi]